MHSPSASIIVPVWNGQELLSSCLESVLKQDYPAELIIIDDGSTDRSLEVAKNSVSGRSDVKILIHAENQGLGITLNEGIKHAQGQYLLIIHQDCEILQTDFLRNAIRTLESRGDIAVVTGRRLYQIEKLGTREKLFMAANGHLAEIEHGGDAEEDVPFVEHKCDVFRKNTLEGIGGFPGNNFRASGEDQVVSSRLRAAGFRLVRLGAIAYNLSFGRKESSLGGIFGKMRTYGRTQAGVLLAEKNSALQGISKSSVFLQRTVNRVEMILATSILACGLFLSFFSSPFILIPVAVVIVRLFSYVERLRKLGGKIGLALYGPVLDFVYSIGFLEGVIRRVMGRQL